jgi:hypothetical protein
MVIRMSMTARLQRSRQMRPSMCYLDLDTGLGFDTQIVVK